MKTISFICFEGEEEVVVVAAVTKDEKKFNQDDVNTMLAKEKRATQEIQKRLAAQLAEAKKDVKLTNEEKNILQQEINDLETKYMTVEERARQAAEKSQKQYEEDRESLVNERDTWQRRYTSATIDVEISKASALNKAVSAEQIGAILRPATKLTERVNEDGNPSGYFEPRVAFNDHDKNGKPITLDLSVPEAVKRMTELDAYGNLFVSGKTGGLGGLGNVGKRTGDIDIATIARTDSAQYRKLRKEKPELFAKQL